MPTLPCKRRISMLLVALALVSLALSAGCRTPAARGDHKLTVLLIEYKGPEAASSAKRLATELSSKGLPDVFTVDGAGLSSVCAGRFDSFEDKAAHEMVRRVIQIRDPNGQYPFAGCMLVQMPEPLPETPWPIEKAPGLYSLYVAGWEAPGRMAKAQTYAAELRSQGFEAYVLQGPRLSMVTIGGFGSDIFEIPMMEGFPGARPNVIDKRVLDLMSKFDYLRLEGELTPPEAKLHTFLVKIPGRDQVAASPIFVPKVLYRITLYAIDTTTGLAEGKRSTLGVAQSKDDVPALIAALVRQLVASLPAGQTSRVGLAGIAPVDADSAKEKVDEAVRDSVLAALGKATGKVVLLDVEATRQVLDAAGLKPADVLRNARAARGVRGADFVVTGTVQAFPREGG